MSSPLVKTATPGVYKRGERYVVVFRDWQGKQRKCSARTLAEARKLKASKTTDVERGEFVDSRITFAEYAPSWIDRYKGRTKRGIKPETLADYRKTIERDALPFFGRMRLSHIRPRDIKEYAASIEKRGVAAGTVRLHLAPVKALLADALEEDLIRSNPTAGVRITTAEAPATSLDDEDEEQAKALSEEELAVFLATLSADPLEKGWAAWRPFFEFLAHTGLRIGEAIALKWGDVDLGERQVQVRRRLYRGRIDRPKSKYGRRKVRISEGLARQLWALRGRQLDDALVFPSTAEDPRDKDGKPRPPWIDASNVMARVLKPAAVAAGLGEWVEFRDSRGKAKRRAESWVGFHTFRHTSATLLFTKGQWNAKQVQIQLGHHSPAFTLATYVHLLPGDLPDPAFLDALTVEGATSEATRPTENDRDAAPGESAETLEVPDVPRLAEAVGAES
jgi:integrase